MQSLFSSKKNKEKPKSTEKKASKKKKLQKDDAEKSVVSQEVAVGSDVAGQIQIATRDVNSSTLYPPSSSAAASCIPYLTPSRMSTDDIGLEPNIKAALHKIIELLKYPEVMAFLGIEIPKNIHFTGPESRRNHMKMAAVCVASEAGYTFYRSTFESRDDADQLQHTLGEAVLHQKSVVCIDNINLLCGDQWLLDHNYLQWLRDIIESYTGSAGHVVISVGCNQRDMPLLLKDIFDTVVDFKDKTSCELQSPPSSQEVVLNQYENVSGVEFLKDLDCASKDETSTSVETNLDLGQLSSMPTSTSCMTNTVESMQFSPLFDDKWFLHKDRTPGLLPVSTYMSSMPASTSCMTNTVESMQFSPLLADKGFLHKDRTPGLLPVSTYTSSMPTSTSSVDSKQFSPSVADKGHTLLMPVSVSTAMDVRPTSTHKSQVEFNLESNMTPGLLHALRDSQVCNQWVVDEKNTKSIPGGCLNQVVHLSEDRLEKLANNNVSLVFRQKVNVQYAALNDSSTVGYVMTQEPEAGACHLSTVDPDTAIAYHLSTVDPETSHLSTVRSETVAGNLSTKDPEAVADHLSARDPEAVAHHLSTRDDDTNLCEMMDA